MISVFNEACRRPHLPSEQHIRDMMDDLGIQISFKPRSHDPDSDEGEAAYENAEEEDVTDDEHVDTEAVRVVPRVNTPTS